MLSIKVPIRKKSGNLFNDPRIYCIYDFRYRILNELIFCSQLNGFKYCYQTLMVLLANGYIVSCIVI